MPADEIDSLSLDRNLASQEGISTDQMTRVRLAYLQGQNSTLVQQTQFADAKAGALLAMIGLIATRGPGAAFDPKQVTAEGLALVLLHASGLLACLIVLIPRYVGKGASYPPKIGLPDGGRPRRQTLNGLTPYEFICKQWTSEPERVIVDPTHQMPWWLLRDNLGDVGATIRMRVEVPRRSS